MLAWGSDANGQLGNGTSTDTNTPVRVRLPHGTRVTAISAGETFSLARTASGKVLAWGSNFEGELGNGSTADSDIPVRVRLPGTSRVTSLAAGAFPAVAGTSGGPLPSPGANNLGQLGTGSSAESSDVPVRVAISQSPARPGASPPAWPRTSRAALPRRRWANKNGAARAPPPSPPVRSGQGAPARGPQDQGGQCQLALTAWP